MRNPHRPGSFALDTANLTGRLPEPALSVTEGFSPPTDGKYVRILRSSTGCRLDPPSHATGNVTPADASRNPIPSQTGRTGPRYRERTGQTMGGDRGCGIGFLETALGSLGDASRRLEAP